MNRTQGMAGMLMLLSLACAVGAQVEVPEPFPSVVTQPAPDADQAVLIDVHTGEGASGALLVWEGGGAKLVVGEDQYLLVATFRDDVWLEAFEARITNVGTSLVQVWDWRGRLGERVPFAGLILMPVGAIEAPLPEDPQLVCLQDGDLTLCASCRVALGDEMLSSPGCPGYRVEEAR